MTTPEHPTPASPRSNGRGGLLTVLVAAAACSVCLLPAVAGGAALASVAGWVTDATGLAAAAVVLSIMVAVRLWQRRSPRASQVSGCDDDCT